MEINQAENVGFSVEIGQFLDSHFKSNVSATCPKSNW